MDLSFPSNDDGDEEDEDEQSSSEAAQQGDAKKKKKNVSRVQLLFFANLGGQRQDTRIFDWNEESPEGISF
jgi:hypothetical protein